MNNDVSNWWAPNGKALCGMCRAAGFSRAELVVGPSMKRSWFGRLRPRLRHYRAAVRAFK
jgi:hypothetical protein